MGGIGDHMGGIGDHMGGMGDHMGHMGGDMGDIGDDMGDIGDCAVLTEEIRHQPVALTSSSCGGPVAFGHRFPLLYLKENGRAVRNTLM